MYRRLTPADRYHIEVLRGQENSVRKISRMLRVSPSTISRELRRCRHTYEAGAAHANALKLAKQRSYGQLKIKGVLKAYVDEKIREDWSPEQIAAVRLKKRLTSISFTTIYRYVERDSQSGGDLKSHLRILRRKFKDRKRLKYRKSASPVRDRIPISQRPKIIEKRKRIGDYERDLVFGGKDGPVLLTIVDRKTKYTHIACVRSKKPKHVHEATVKALKGRQVRSITNDNGIEFAFHKKTAKELRTKIYFARAYASWERGTNENINGLLRQYVPRRSPLTHTTAKQMRALEQKLNNRPRKCLGYRTPADLYLRKSGQVLR